MSTLSNWPGFERALTYRGWECVLRKGPPYAWYAHAEETAEDSMYAWDAALNDDIKTLNEAWKFVKPRFKAMVDRMRKK